MQIPSPHYNDIQKQTCRLHQTLPDLRLEVPCPGRVCNGVPSRVCTIVPGRVCDQCSAGYTVGVPGGVCDEVPGRVYDGVPRRVWNALPGKSWNALLRANKKMEGKAESLERGLGGVSRRVRGMMKTLRRTKRVRSKV
jgi:hypothetical protein